MRRADHDESPQGVAKRKPGAERKPHFLTLSKPLDPAKPYLNPVRLRVADLHTYSNIAAKSDAVIHCPAGFFAIVSS